jgi:hypothetical protein
MVLLPLPGDELVPRRTREPLPLGDRLWVKIAGPWYSTPECPIGDDDCWLWIAEAKAGAYRTRDGRPRRTNSKWWYGRISRGRRAEGVVSAHRAAYELTYGEVPKDPEKHPLIRHLCNRPLCCNPRHMAVGTAAENGADVRAAGTLKGHNQYTRRRAREVAA